jgi:hypothetical protein
MAPDDDPTVGIPSSPTQPLPPTPARQPEDPAGRGGGWRPGQVAVVALLALLLGATGGVLTYFLADDRSPEDPQTAARATTTTSASTTTTAEAGTPSSTTEPETEATTTVPGGADGGGSSSGGQTAVGNSTFSASYQSNDDRSTGEFTVDDGWQIRWEVPTGTVRIEVYEAAGELLESIAAQERGERTFAEGGSYRVEIDTDGSRYSVVITDGP